MAYTRGNSSQIVVGAAALFIHNAGPLTGGTTPAAYVAGTSHKETLSSDANYTNVGYTNNGLELMFQPDFGEVKVDQVLDVAKLFKQGMKVELKTSFAEATLENLLIATAGNDDYLADQSEGVSPVITGKELTLHAGELGEYPLERGLVAVGASVETSADSFADIDATGTGADQAERVYTAYRALSIQNVTVSAKRDAATEFEVTFRLLPDGNGVYGKIVDRVY